MVDIAHISDVHLAPMPPVPPWALFNKRITGYINWRLNRQAHLHRDTLRKLVDHLKVQHPQFTAVTGDLVNLALDSEMTRAAEWVKRLGSAQRVCVIPGNHDAYVPGSRDKFRAAMGEYAGGETIDDHPFPFVRRVGDVAIVGCNSAVSTPPFFANGNFSRGQAARLRQILTALGKADMFRTVLIHHPPVLEFAQDWRRGLRGADMFRHVIADCGAELILHGHLHRSTVSELKGPEGPVPVVGVAAGSADANAGHDPARYNLFSINRDETTHKWACTMREYGYQRIGDDIVMRLEMRIS